MEEADKLTDYAVEIRYPDDWYEPGLDEARQAYDTALKAKDFILRKIES
ncbi:MAG: HEPN domain-containing protein [Oligoflexia bacterium]|nr:HEPN domain-containing protein [Oligoflexia bacterium]